MRWPTGADVTAIRSRERTYSKFYLGVQRGKERTSGCATYGAGGVLYVGCHYQLGAADAYDGAEHVLTFNDANILVGTDIRPGMTMAVGTLADPFLYGSARIRYVDIGNDRIFLEPNNLAVEGYLIAGDYIWVDGVYRLYRILPRIDSGTVYEDGNPDSAAPGWGLEEGIPFNANYLDRPVALMGSPRFAWTGEAINLYGWRSHARGGRAITTYLWDLDGGVAGGAGVNAAGTPAAPVTARWDTAGEYIVRLTVTDNSGNAANDFYGVPFEDHVAVRPVLVYDRPGEGSNPPYTDFEVGSLGGRYGSGWSLKITVYGTADKSEFPDNALVILFCEDWYGGNQGSRGGWYGQESILFCGYIQADTVEVDSEKSSVSFEARTIEQWMKDISVWPANCLADAAPNEWKEFPAMTCEDVLWYLAEVRSTLKTITDCFFASDVNAQKALDFVDLTEASLYDQMSDQIGSCFFGEVSASRHGSIHLFKHKNMMDLAERVTYGPPIRVFYRRDWRDELEIGDEQMRDSVAQVDFIGFYYDTDGNPQEVYSLSPLNQTNFGTIEKVTGILLTRATAQAEANTLSGLYRAWKNIRFPHCRVPALNDRFLEPATLDYFGVTLAVGDTVRGYEWDAKEFLCTEVSYEINQEKGVIIVDVTGEASTWGPPGSGSIGEYPGDIPPAEPPPDEPPEYWGIWPEDDPPDWEDEDGDGAIFSKVTWQAAHLDNNGIQTTDDIEAAPVVWNMVLANNFLWDFDMIVGAGNTTIVWVCSQIVATVYRSTDGMANWTTWNLPDPANDAGDGTPPTWASGDLWAVGIRIDPTNTSRVIIAVEDATNHDRLWVYRTENAMAAIPTWSSQGINTTAGGWDNNFGAYYGINGLHIATNGDIWLMVESNWTAGFSRNYLFRSTDHGVSYTEIDVMGVDVDEGHCGGGIRTLRETPTTVIYSGGWRSAAPTDYRLFTSLDRGATWINLTSAVPNEVVTLRRDPLDNNRLVAYMYATGLYESLSRGFTWQVIDGWPHVNADMQMHPFVPDRIIGSQMAGGATEDIRYSDDGGLTTTKVDDGAQEAPRVAFARRWW